MNMIEYENMMNKTGNEEGSFFTYGQPHSGIITPYCMYISKKKKNLSHTTKPHIYSLQSTS